MVCLEFLLFMIKSHTKGEMRHTVSFQVFLVVFFLFWLCGFFLILEKHNAEPGIGNSNKCCYSGFAWQGFGSRGL